MSETNNRRFKILGAGWLRLGGLSFTYMLIGLFPVAQGKAPSATEVADVGWVLVARALRSGVVKSGGCGLSSRRTATSRWSAVCQIAAFIPCSSPREPASINLDSPCTCAQLCPQLWIPIKLWD